MAELTRKYFKDTKIVTITDFRKKYAGGISAQGLSYAMDNGLIDYIQVGPRVRFVVLTPKTLTYTPNPNKRRTYKSRLQT